jgi:hypothetical protein
MNRQNRSNSGDAYPPELGIPAVDRLAALPSNHRAATIGTHTVAIDNRIAARMTAVNDSRSSPF